ncbi:MAG: helix-hairpin-helix domain-containing protein [Bacteroidales bacterium]|nr:helix-hairpin-helix domain-containing protein [Bacteroidales bacterium]MBN2761547.1 helix-hairpin-helix domain-containing protein [Bacteroidales bacterium]
MLRAIIVIVISYFLLYKGHSQNPLPDPSETIRSIIESMEEYERLPEDFSGILDNLDYYRENPLNLNQAGREELERFIFLTEFQVQSLLDYRKDHGPFLSLYELQLVVGFDSITIAYLLPFVRTGEIMADNRLHLNNVISRGVHEILLKEQRIIQTPEGYKALPGSVPPEEAGPYYPGTRDRLLMKYRYHYQKRLFLGLTMEKDAGEEFFTGSNPCGFDFYSGHIQLNELGPVKSIILGDYQVTTGQGLTLWSGSAFGKSSFPSSLYKRQESLKKYGSTDENMFFRGIAVSLAVKNFTLLAFYSSKKADANITDTLPSGITIFSSFQQTGYHRTPAEIYDENAISETALGSSLTYRNNWLKIGSTVVKYNYSGIKQPSDALFRKFEFRGDRLVNAGLDYSLFFRKIQFYGEISWGNNAMATLNGIILKPHQRILFSFLQRSYNPQYHARYAGAVSENSEPCNENALYLGTVFQPFRFWKITAYADFFRFPWMTYSLRQPSSGSDIFMQADFNPFKTLMFDLRFRCKSKLTNLPDENAILAQTQNQNTYTARLHCKVQVSKSLILRSRIEFKTIRADSTGKEEGLLLYQDLVYRFSRIPLQLSMRYALFRTDDYASRLYAYEDDVLYSYSIPALYDEGNRSYAVVRYELLKSLTLWLKWSRTCIHDVTGLGSGPDEIKGNTKSEIKLQLRWVF